MIRPFSHIPSFGEHCCPGVSIPVPADGGSSLSRSGSILPSLIFFIHTRTPDDGSGVCGRGFQYCTVSTGATVTCAASRPRLSTIRLIMAKTSSLTSSRSVFRIRFLFHSCRKEPSLTGVEMAAFNAFTSDHKLAANSSSVCGSERGP